MYSKIYQWFIQYPHVYLTNNATTITSGWKSQMKCYFSRMLKKCINSPVPSAGNATDLACNRSASKRTRAIMLVKSKCAFMWMTWRHGRFPAPVTANPVDGIRPKTSRNITLAWYLKWVWYIQSIWIIFLLISHVYYFRCMSPYC